MACRRGVRSHSLLVNTCRALMSRVPAAFFFFSLCVSCIFQDFFFFYLSLLYVNWQCEYFMFLRLPWNKNPPHLKIEMYSIKYLNRWELAEAWSKAAYRNGNAAVSGARCSSSSAPTGALLPHAKRPRTSTIVLA